MGKYVDWYVVELEHRLSRKLEVAEVHEFVSQVEAHLHDKSEELVTRGILPKDADHEAIRAFGRVGSIANEIVDQLRPRRFLAELGLLGSFAAFMGLLIWFMGFREHYGWAQWERHLLWSAVLSFCVSAFFARRMLWGALVAEVCLLLPIAAYVFGSMRPRPDAWQIDDFGSLVAPILRSLPTTLPLMAMALAVALLLNGAFVLLAKHGVAGRLNFRSQ